MSESLKTVRKPQRKRSASTKATRPLSLQGDREYEAVTNEDGEVEVKFFYKSLNSTVEPGGAIVGSIRVKFLDQSGAPVKAEVMKPSQSGTVKIIGDLIPGYELLDPKEQTIVIAAAEMYEVVFTYKAEAAAAPTGGFCDFYKEFSTVAEGEKFMKECIGAEFEYDDVTDEVLKLKWINFLNAGYWKLFTTFPEIPKLLKSTNKSIRLQLFQKAGSGGKITAGFFQPQLSPECYAPDGGIYNYCLVDDSPHFKGMLIAYNVNVDVDTQAASSMQNFTSKFGASGDKDSTIVHEMGHALHAINAGIGPFLTDYSARDPDNYGTLVAPELEDYFNDVNTKVSQYATQWFPIEFVAEYFNLLVAEVYGGSTHGGEKLKRLQDYYDEVEGKRLDGFSN